MKLMNKSYAYLVIFLILFACCTQETEALRRVLRGRRTFTRSYFEGLLIPGWALVLVIALTELLLGGILYVVMYKFIIAKDTETTTNTYAPASTGYAPASATSYTPAATTPYNPPATIQQTNEREGDNKKSL